MIIARYYSRDGISLVGTVLALQCSDCRCALLLAGRGRQLSHGRGSETAPVILSACFATLVGLLGDGLMHFAAGIRRETPHKFRATPVPKPKDATERRAKDSIGVHM